MTLLAAAALSAAVVAPPGHGTLTMKSWGGFTYVPAAGFTGVDTFTYTVGDSQATSNAATVSITVHTLPQTVPDVYATAENQPLSVATGAGILSNDSNGDGVPFVAQLVNQPQHGTLTLGADGSFGYTPNKNFYGSDVFTYQAVAGTAKSTATTVTLGVTFVNQPPTAQDDAFAGLENQTINVTAGAGLLANDQDVDSPHLTAALVSDAQHGHVTLAADGSFAYMPNANFTGMDTFTYQASDGALLSNVATATVYLYQPNQRPSATDDLYSLAAGTTLTVGGATLSKANFAGLQEINHARAARSFTPSQIEYSAAYNLLFVKQGTSTIHVLDASSGADLGTHAAINQFTDFDVKAQDGRYLYVADYGGTNIGYGTPSTPSYVHRYDAATRTWQTESVTGIAYQVEAVDDSRFLLKSIDQWVTITLNAFGSPSSTSATQLATIGADYEGDFEFDPASGRIYMGNSGNSSREIHVYQLTGNTLTAKEATGVYGSAQNGGGSSVLSSDDKSFFYGALQVDAFSVGSNIRTLPEVIEAAAGGIAFGQNGGYYSIATGELLGKLTSASILYATRDDGGSVWVYDSQNAVFRQYSLSTAAQGVLQNDTDPEGDPMNAGLVSGPAHGTLSLASNGSFVYTPASGFTGLDSFTYSPADSGGPGPTATVTLQVLNPAVTNLVPSAQRTVVNEPVSFTSAKGTLISVNSAVALAQLSVELKVDHGSLAVSGTPATLTLTGNGSGDVVLSGSLADVNAALATLVFTPQIGFVGDSTLSITSTVPQLAPVASQVVITTHPAPWHHIGDPCDVTEDGLVSPADALVLINDLLTGSRTLSVPGALAAAAPQFMVDVNADNLESPLDLLLVVDYLKSPPVAQGTAEAAANQITIPIDGGSLFAYTQQPVQSVILTLLRQFIAGRSRSANREPGRESNDRGAHRVVGAPARPECFRRYRRACSAAGSGHERRHRAHHQPDDRSARCVTDEAVGAVVPMNKRLPHDYSVFRYSITASFSSSSSASGKVCPAALLPMCVVS